MRVMMDFTRTLLAMKMPWPLWVGLMMLVNMVAPIYFFEALEAKVVLAAALAGMLVQTAVFQAKGFVRLLGIGHIFWIPLVIWLWIRWDQAAPGETLAHWMIAVVVVNSLSLILDAYDVLRYLRGDRQPTVVPAR